MKWGRFDIAVPALQDREVTDAMATRTVLLTE